MKSRILTTFGWSSFEFLGCPAQIAQVPLVSEEVGVEQLERDDSSRFGVEGAVDGAGAATAYGELKLELIERGPIGLLGVFAHGRRSYSSSRSKSSGGASAQSPSKS